MIDELASHDFARVRIGIGTKNDMVRHVLGKFDETEREEAERSVERAADAVESLVTEGIATSMNRFNTRS